jgi:PPM family protein phosphatase
VEASVSSLAVEAWGTTDVGMKRRVNEDTFVTDPEHGVFLVADGMGGHAAGEVASKLAAEEILHTLSVRAAGSNQETWPDHWAPERSRTANLVVDAVLAGHQRVTGAVTRDTNLKGMGTTVVVAAHTTGSRTLTICHVGDSRAYRLRGAKLELLTEDHSWVHEQVQAGFLSEEAARSHPLKNVVTQALGGSTEPRVDILETEMEDGDLYLLCSDGLNSMLTDDDIAGILRSNSSLKDLGEQLVVAANRQGGNDNVTVVLLRCAKAAC